MLALDVDCPPTKILLLENERLTMPDWTILDNAARQKLLTATLMKHSRLVVFIDPSCLGPFGEAEVALPYLWPDGTRLYAGDIDNCQQPKRSR